MINRNNFLAIVLAFLAIAPATTAFAADDDPSIESSDPGMDQEVSALIAQMRHDLTKAKNRSREVLEASRNVVPYSFPRGYIPEQPQLEASGLSKLRALILPILGMSQNDLVDTYGAPRDGGRRSHRGIDIFAPRGAEVVAVADGTVSFVGNQRKGGKVVWLVGDDGASYYYAHLDRWSEHINEGMQVSRGTVLGYVGNSGNARRSSPHLHFAINANDESVNPYVLLKAATGETVLAGGFGSQ
jgi:murein DD-endopeptidase MepM/ murein hydrolase activator NlpD